MRALPRNELRGVCFWYYIQGGRTLLLLFVLSYRTNLGVLGSSKVHSKRAGHRVRHKNPSAHVLLTMWQEAKVLSPGKRVCHITQSGHLEFA